MKLSMEDVFLFLKDVIQDLNLIIAGFPLATGCHWSPFLGSADAPKRQRQVYRNVINEHQDHWESRFKSFPRAPTK